METIKVTGTIPNQEKPGATYQVSFIGEKESPLMLQWMEDIIERGGVYEIVRNWLGVLLVALVVTGPVHAAKHYSMTFDQMTSYANNAILDAAQDGQKAVTLRFPGASMATIDQLTESLRARGYALDEEMALNNPEIVKVRFLKSSAMASR